MHLEATGGRSAAEAKVDRTSRYLMQIITRVECGKQKDVLRQLRNWHKAFN
jgi:hypothetical protein